eukprot:2637879-Ditylum_brightwellii.AAC.1
MILIQSVILGNFVLITSALDAGARKLTTFDVTLIASSLVVFAFFFILFRKIDKIRKQEENERAEFFSQTLEPVNVYHDASLDPINFFQSTVVFLTQWVLINVYIGSIFDLDAELSESNNDTDSLLTSVVYLIAAILAVIVYALNSNFAQDMRDSVDFWGS